MIFQSQRPSNRTQKAADLPMGTPEGALCRSNTRLLWQRSGKGFSRVVKRKLPWTLCSRHVFITLTPVILLVWASSLCPDAFAQNRVQVDVKIILASQDGPPQSANATSGYGLAAPLVQDLRSRFRYSSYWILGVNQMSLKVGQTGSAVLPGKRRLDITPLAITNKRAELRLQLQRDDRQVFQTVIQLLNKGNLIVGGPKHQNGVLLFNVSNQF